MYNLALVSKACVVGVRPNMKMLFSYYSSLALVVQWIEQFRPKEKIGVRFFSRAPI